MVKYFNSYINIKVHYTITWHQELPVDCMYTLSAQTEHVHFYIPCLYATCTVIHTDIDAFQAGWWLSSSFSIKVWSLKTMLHIIADTVLFLHAVSMHVMNRTEAQQRHQCVFQWAQHYMYMYLLCLHSFVRVAFHPKHSSSESSPTLCSTCIQHTHCMSPGLSFADCLHICYTLHKKHHLAYNCPLHT